MTEMEKEILPDLLNAGIIKSYIRYVDDTLVMLKTEEIENVLNIFNSFDKNLEFTVDRFEDGLFHFLDISITHNKETDMYVKPTNTGQYCNFKSFVPWHYKISWAYALYSRCMRLCSSPILKKKHVSRLNKLLSWNGFPNYIRKRLLLKFKTDFESNSKRKNNTNDDDKNDELSIILKLPYMGPEGEKLVRTLRKKISKNISRKLLIKIIWTTTKISDFCSIKDKLPNEQKNQIIYNITCPACGEKYVGKTECCFKTRMDEHGTRAEQPMFQHLLNCSAFSYLMHLHDMPSKNN